MAGARAKKIENKNRDIQKPSEITPDEIEEALSAEQRLRNSYYSLSSHLNSFRPCTDESLEPVGGTIIYALWSRGRLTHRQTVAWHTFWGDLRASAGSSGNLTVSYSERVATSSAGVSKPDSGRDDSEPITARALAPVKLAHWNQEFLRVEKIWGILNHRQKGVAEQIIRDYLRCSGCDKNLHSHDLKYIGAFLSGYRDQKLAGAYGVCLIHELLENIAAFYRIK